MNGSNSRSGRSVHGFAAALAPLGLVVLAWLISGCSQAGDSEAGNSRAGGSESEPRRLAGNLEFLGDGTARATGVVLRNERYCERDLACWLLLGIEGREVEVYYSGIGDGDPCPNRKAYDTGAVVEANRRVEVFAAVVSEAQRVRLSLCPDERFYLRVLEN